MTTERVRWTKDGDGAYWGTMAGGVRVYLYRLSVTSWLWRASVRIGPHQVAITDWKPVGSLAQAKRGGREAGRMIQKMQEAMP